MRMRVRLRAVERLGEPGDVGDHVAWWTSHRFPIAGVEGLRTPFES